MRKHAACAPVAPVPGTPKMNGMERKYALLLEARKRAGEVAGYWFEGATFRLGDSARYTPDFLVQLADGTMELHETKGFMREAARVRLQVCARMYPFPVKLIRRDFSVEDVAA